MSFKQIKSVHHIKRSYLFTRIELNGLIHMDSIWHLYNLFESSKFWSPGSSIEGQKQVSLKIS